MSSVAFYFIFILCAARSLNANSTHLLKSDDVQNDNAIYEKYAEMDKSLKKLVNSGVKAVLPYLLKGREDFNVSASCTNDLFRLVSDVRKLKLSAFKLLDAVAKVPSGMISGNTFQYGDYDECVTTTETRKDGSIAYRGQYCVINIRPILPKRRRVITMQSGIKELREATKNTSEVMQYIASVLHYSYAQDIKFGLCIPSGCSSEDINSVTKYIGDQIMLKATVEYCTVQHDYPMSTGKIIAIFSFSLVGFFSIFGTALDYYARKRDTTFQTQIANFLQCFSILTNFPKVITAKITEKNMSSLFGIRALSLFYIILLHNYFFLDVFSIEENMLHYRKEFPSFFYQILLNGFLTTEVFIFLGGFFHSYSILKYMEKGKRKISYGAMLIHRLLRIYPPYLFIIMSIYILRSFSGPFSAAVEQRYWQNCDKNWWRNLIFINNFYNQEDACLNHGWYMAVDMQLYLISMFTVPLFAKNPKKGVSVHLGILVIGLISTSLWAWYKDILPAIVSTRLNMDELNGVWNAYTTTFPHIAPYFVGILFGYAISAYKDFKIPLMYRVIGWLVAVVAFMSMLFMTYRWNSVAPEPSVVESVLYFSLSRLIYVSAVGWMIVCCVRGYGGIVNYILSLKVWIPISRISYMMFLVSPIVQTFYISHLKEAIYNEGLSMIWRYIGDLGVSFLVALAMSTIIESPFVALEKLIFRRQSKEETKDVENNNQTKINTMIDEKAQIAIELENNFKNATMDLQLKI